MSNVPNDLKYAKSHEWAKLEGENLVRVGITDFAQAELGDLVYIELPDVGRKVTAGEPCAVVESVKTASDLYSPASGEIAEINRTIPENPEAVNDDPYAAWLFCVKARDPSELESLLSAEQYRSHIQE